MANPRSSFSPLNARVDSVEPMPAGEARWIKLNKINYTDPSGKSRSWESAERQTRPKDTETDGVGVIAILHQPGGGGVPSLLLQKQFRPPLNKVTIEVPSGLIDEGETVAQSALRELKEETGYVGTIPGCGNGNSNNSNDDDAAAATAAAAAAAAAEGFIMWNDPGFCNTNTKMMFVDVDLADPRNQPDGLRPELEENEYIECFSLPLATLWDDLTRLDREGFAIDARVATLAQGMEMARKWKHVLL